MSRDRKLVVLGLDGATWRLLDPLIEAGRLPNLARAAKGGVRAPLTTVLPPISCPAWFCYSTGKNPGKLGIFGWRNFNPATKEDRFNDYASMPEPEVWDYLGAEGHRCAVVNIPTHFPPKQINGFMVAGMQAEEHQAYTTPPELKDEIKELFDYRVQPRYKMLWDYDKGLEDILALFPKRFQVLEHLLDDVDFAHATIFHIDEVQHNAWGTEDLNRAWERVDELVGGFMEDHPDVDILFMSDHGFVSRQTVFHINHWLQSHGYLVRKPNPMGEGLRKVGVNRQRLEQYLKRWGLLNIAKAIVPESLQRVVKDKGGGSSHQRRLAEIDWERTVAFASTNYSLHVMDPGLVDTIIDELRALEHPETGEPFFETVVRADEHLHGPRMEWAPQVLYVPADGNAVGDGLSGGHIWGEHAPNTGGHAMDGIFMAYGPSFKDGVELDEASLLDLAPTILHAFGMAVPKDVDGRVLDVFKEATDVATRDDEVEAGAFTDEELEKVEDRLRGLGYLE